MLIKALERAEGSRKAELLSWIGKEEYKPEEKIAAVTGLYNELGIKAVCENKMREYYAKGIMSLQEINVDGERKQELKKFAEHLMYREM